MKFTPERQDSGLNPTEPEIMFRNFRQKPLGLIAILLIILILVLVSGPPRALPSAK